MQKVRDHCHYTGKYCGAAHIICKLISLTSTDLNLVVDALFSSNSQVLVL